MLALRLESRRATRHLAAAVATTLSAGDVVWLEGELGAGKTFFTRGLLRALGVPSVIPVTSPTFALMHEHEGRAQIRHLDLYRLSDTDELTELGLGEAMDSAIVVIEWGARFRDAIGARGIEVTLEPLEGPKGRAAAVRALDSRGEAQLVKIAEDPHVARRALHGPQG
ncbi:MAG: tRNA (adenosine(37)-N6)-threonylcarbamoyltransferase complex ATPase subunit type 1 TsaE [Sandaracinaceae bacterium]